MKLKELKENEKDFLESYLNDDVIGKIYHGDLNLEEYQPVTVEYVTVNKYIRSQEKELLSVQDFEKYLETRNIRDSIEAEEQFKLGFKTAIKIIMESYR